MISRSTLIGVVIIVVILVAIGALLAQKGSDDAEATNEGEVTGQSATPRETNTATSSNTSPSPTLSSSTMSSPTSAPTTSTVTRILMTSAGFSPASFTIARGATACFVNNDTSGRWPASDNHPSHLLYPAFDPKRAIPAGDEWCFAFDRSGTWEYHDHLKPSFTGTATVQ